MKSKIKYTDELMGKLKIINDFLPQPEQLILRENNNKKKVALKKPSLEFFKKKAT